MTTTISNDQIRFVASSALYGAVDAVDPYGLSDAFDSRSEAMAAYDEELQSLDQVQYNIDFLQEYEDEDLMPDTAKKVSLAITLLHFLKKQIMREQIFDRMSCDMGVMSEYGDDEQALRAEISSVDDDILNEYWNTFCK